MSAGAEDTKKKFLKPKRFLFKKNLSASDEKFRFKIQPQKKIQKHHPTQKNTNFNFFNFKTKYGSNYATKGTGNARYIALFRK